MDKLKTRIQNYWDWRSSSFGLDSDKSSAIADQWESVLTRLASGLPGNRALDIGTGTGQFALYLARIGLDVSAVDISEKMISRSTQYARLQKLCIGFQTGDAESLVYKDNTFDVVTARNLLWTLPDPDKALEEWRRVLKPGGSAIISDGLWMNTTWKRIHRLVFNTFKGMFRNGSWISLRFFWSYVGLQKSLPFYEGIRFENARSLLHASRFKDIQFYDTNQFAVHPYGRNETKKKIRPSFFIAYAKK